MPAKPSGEIKTIVVRQKQKNGDIYVFERQIKYDPEKKYNVILSSKILGKIPQGEKDIVPTRPKRKSKKKSTDLENNASVPEQLGAKRTKVGMMDIVDHIGKSSGIDDAIYRSTDDTGTAQKLLSVARYLFATNGRTLPGITTWQYTHPLPYEYGLSEDVYHDLFESVGRDETLQQSFFLERCSALKGRAVLAYDSTTISTYSANLPEARKGFNKDGDGLDTVKLLTLYSIDTRQPIAFTKQPGNLPDVISIENALKELEILGVTDAEIITDNGYYSEKNLSDLFLAHFDFITLVRTNIRWIRDELLPRMDAFRSTSSVCPFDTGTHGITVPLMHEFTKVRKYTSKKTGARKGDEETFRRRIYLHLYFNPMRRAEEDTAFDKDLWELRHYLEKGIAAEDLSEAAQNKVSKYLIVKYRGDQISVSFNEEAIAEHNKYHGYFALVSNCEKDAFDCLYKYRRRGTIESFFESGKQKADGKRTRVWSTDCLRGRMFVQFVSLCYYEYLCEELRKLKAVLGKANGNPKHDLKTNLDAEKKLLSWLNNNPTYLILQWFDVVEEVHISTKLKSKRWNTETTQRDRMLMEKLGVVRSS